jgi:hypothetical protein
MKRTINVEAEGLELILKNKAGDYVIIPKKHRSDVQNMLKKGQHDRIDNLVATLPLMEDYAEDGSLYSEYLTPDPPVKSEITYSGGDLPEVQVQAQAPSWVKHKKQYVKDNPFNIDTYVQQRYDNPVGREAIKKIDETGWKKELRAEGLQKRYSGVMDYVGEQLVKEKPQGKLSRAEWLNQMSDKEEELIKRNPKYQSSLWADTKRGLTSITEGNLTHTFKNILSSPDFSNREKREMLKDYIDHPAMSQLGDLAKVLYPLTVPSKVVQSAYRNDYSTVDALKGKKNKAGVLEDIATDPLNLVGIGIWNKLSKAGKFNKLDEAYDAVKGLSKKEQLSKLTELASSTNDMTIPATPKKQWQPQELPGLHLKSTMEGEAISKIVEPKTGLINTEQALAIIAKEADGKDKVAIVKQVLGENIPKKMDYNEFRKLIQDELIPLEKEFNPSGNSAYGLINLGYKILKPRSAPTFLERAADILDTPIGDLFKKKIKETNPLLENRTLILSNESKFGRGSSAHTNPEETLGHIHFLRDIEAPDVLTVTQIQSDAFQGKHVIMPKTLDEAKAKLEVTRAKLESVKQSNSDKSILKNLEKEEKLARLAVENFTQKQLLGKNHQERYLQELVNYAAARKDVSKIRLPTVETAAKVQNYKRRENSVVRELEDFKKGKFSHFYDLSQEARKFITVDSKIPSHYVIDNKIIHRSLDEIISDFEKSPIFAENLEKLKGLSSYAESHQTILKKYKDQPKTIKKLFGQEPTIVTDNKGNTWYEFDIPEKFKKGKGEIKAYNVLPPAAAASYLQSQKDKKE